MVTVKSVLHELAQRIKRKEELRDRAKQELERLAKDAQERRAQVERYADELTTLRHMEELLTQVAADLEDEEDDVESEQGLPLPEKCPRLLLRCASCGLLRPENAVDTLRTTHAGCGGTWLEG